MELDLGAEAREQAGDGREDAAEQHERARDHEAAEATRARELIGDRRLPVDRRDRRAGAHRGDQRARELDEELGLVGAEAERGELAARRLAIAERDRHHEARVRGALGGREGQRAAEVEHRELAVDDEEVSRVRVGVHAPAREDLRGDLADERREELRARRRVGRLEHRDEPLAVEARHREHARARPVRDRLGHAHGAAGERAERLGLGDIVELAGERAGELVGQRRKIGAGEIADRGRDGAQRGDVGRDDILDAGDLHLDRDAAAVEQGRAVDLRERGGGERHVVERGEQLGDRPAELRLDARADGGDVDGRNVVLQLRELARPDRADEIGPARRELPELRDAAAQPPRGGRGPAREVAVVIFAQREIAAGRRAQAQPAMPGEERAAFLREASRARGRAIEGARLIGGGRRGGGHIGREGLGVAHHGADIARDVEGHRVEALARVLEQAPGGRERGAQIGGEIVGRGGGAGLIGHG